jgi:hypothetical protein
MVTGKFETITVIATADFSTELLQYLVVNAAGGIATGDNDAVGIMQTRGIIGDHMTVGYQGHMKARAGAAIAKGAPIMVGTGGHMITATGATRVAKSKSLVAAATGDLFEFIGNFANTRVLAKG